MLKKWESQSMLREAVVVVCSALAFVVTSPGLVDAQTLTPDYTVQVSHR